MHRSRFVKDDEIVDIGCSDFLFHSKSVLIVAYKGIGNEGHVLVIARLAFRGF